MKRMFKCIIKQYGSKITFQGRFEDFEAAFTHYNTTQPGRIVELKESRSHEQENRSRAGQVAT